MENRILGTTERTRVAFATELSTLIAEWTTDKGLDLGDALSAMKAEVVAIRHELLGTKATDAFNTKHGLPPMTNEQVRQILQLEPYEPIPPRRE